MSFLREVIQTVDEITLEQIDTKISGLTKEVNTCKSDVSVFLDNAYVNFTKRPKEDQILITKIKNVHEDVEKLKKDSAHISKIELPKNNMKMQKSLESLEKLNVTISIVGVYYSIHESLIKIGELRQINSLTETVKVIQDVEKLFDTTDDHSDIMAALKEQLHSEKQSLLLHLSIIFKDHVIFEANEDTNYIKIKTNSKLLQEVLSALYQYKTIISPLHNVIRFLWDNMFVPAVDYITDITIKEDEEKKFNILELKIVDSSKKSNYTFVFSRIELIIKFLSSHFNFNLDKDLDTLSYIGRDMRDNLSELLIKHCLEDTVPSSEEGLELYKNVIEDTKQLEKTLVEHKIFANDTISILEYAENIDVLFINKKCQMYLKTVQNLMKKDLHDMIEVGVDDNNLTKLEFPKSSISRNVLEILKLAENILIEATKASDICSGRLCTIVRNIFENYARLVPEYHKKLLQTIPQQIALFYNNCNYICYQLTKWNELYPNLLPSVLEIRIIFQDEILKLENVAATMFQSYVENQIKQIHEIIKTSGLQSQQTLQQVESGVDKALRQCLRQQELLKTVWHKVLPYDLYNKTLGKILDALSNELINSIVKFEDISSDAAEQLVEILKMVQTRGPKLFTDPKEVSLFVKSWYKLNELIFVLNASLVDINDRWTDGKGPLALQFKPLELKQLVRALFQNTERRATLLSKIRD